MQRSRKTPWEHRPRYSVRSKARAAATLRRRQEMLANLDAPAEEQAPLLPKLEWAQQYRRIDDQQFSLERFKPLEQIYRDDHPQIAVIKPAQVGVSEFAVTLTIWALIEGYKIWCRDLGIKKDGINVGYCFPTKVALSDFSKERFTGLKRESEFLSAVFADADFNEVGFKQVRDSYLYLRGAWSTEALLSFPADLLILDEFDRMDAAAVELARKRIRQSQIKRQVVISTPTNPGTGVDALYAISDQNVWEVLCSDCGEHSELDYFRDVRASGQDYEDWKYWERWQIEAAKWSVHCPNCKAEIDRFGPGRWRALKPDSTRWRGYRVPALAFPSVKLDELGLLAISDNPTIKTEFYRSDLGLAYAPADCRLTVDMLKKLSADLPGGKLPAVEWSRTTMGVDVGSRFHYVIESTGSDGKRYVRAAGNVRTWAELSQLLTRYKVRSCVVDSKPELHACKAWADKHKGRVKRADYPNGVEGRLFRLGNSEERKLLSSQQKKSKSAKAETQTEAVDSDIVQINRTMAMDAVFAQFSAGEIHCPQSVHDEPEFQAHMCAPTREVITTKEGDLEAVWNHSAPDHLYHAAVYAMIALEVMPKKTPGVFAQASTGGWSPLV